MIKKSAALSLLAISQVTAAIDMQEAQRLIATEYEDAKATEIREVQKGGDKFYEIEFVRQNTEYEALVTPQGRIVDISEDGGGPPLIIGAAVIFDDTVYRDLDSQVIPVPVIYGDIGNFWFRGISFGYYLYDDNDVKISPMIQINPGDGYEEDDVKSGSRLYDGLEDRELTVDFGVNFEYDMGWAEAEVSLLADVSGEHDGWTAAFSLGKTYNPTNTLSVVPSISAIYRDDKVNQYFYGVEPQFETDFRPAYEADGGIDYEIGVFTTWMFTDRWYLYGSASYTLVDDEVDSSPLVDSDNSVSAIFGIGYVF